MLLMYAGRLVGLFIYVCRSTFVTSRPIHNTSHFRRDAPVRARNVRGENCEFSDVKCYLCALVDLLIVCYVRRSTLVTSRLIHATSHFRRDTPVRARNVRGALPWHHLCV